jgi:hypothetical protein
MTLKSAKTPANATGCAIAKLFLGSCFVLFGVCVCVSLCLCACFSVWCRSKIKPTKEDYTGFTHFSSWCNALSEALRLTPTIHVTVFFCFFGGVILPQMAGLLLIFCWDSNPGETWKFKGCWQAGKLIPLLLPDWMPGQVVSIFSSLPPCWGRVGRPPRNSVGMMLKFPFWLSKVHFLLKMLVQVVPFPFILSPLLPSFDDFLENSAYYT